MQVGTSRNSSVSGGADYPFTLAQLREYYLRVVSPLTARIHFPGELNDFDQASSGSMRSCCLQPADGGETLEIELFSRQQRIRLEVRDHAAEEILEPTRLPLQRLVAAIRPDASASELGL